MNFKSTYFRGVVLLILVTANLFIWRVVFAEEDDTLTVTFLNIGQGDAIFIEAPNGVQLLIDAGPNKKVLSELGAVMPFFDRSIDLLLATHPDADHIGGFPDVLSRYRIRGFVQTDNSSDSNLYTEMASRLAVEAIPVYNARRGQRIELSPGVYLTILYPDREVRRLDTNDSSIIARLQYGESELLLTGDTSKKIEEYLISLGDELGADILKVAHHGSKTSSAANFIEAVSPTYAVISAGVDNTYGHPHEEVTRILRERNIDILETRNGRIIFSTDGTNWIRK